MKKNEYIGRTIFILALMLSISYCSAQNYIEKEDGEVFIGTYYTHSVEQRVKDLVYRIPNNKEWDINIDFELFIRVIPRESNSIKWIVELDFNGDKYTVPFFNKKEMCKFLIDEILKII